MNLLIYLQAVHIVRLRGYYKMSKRLFLMRMKRTYSGWIGNIASVRFSHDYLLVEICSRIPFIVIASSAFVKDALVSFV